ncbi:ribosomal protein L9, putative [Ixodes scapularis]|uniref:Large ribosomal subunit protein bL9m n=1 Tax=Ixodes scapularis TaxID=6945 RepID=B7PF13_IXOSC|nr:ribosomal protein L9, putative [Ixodes scapularis]|eukprot:XP_002433785.1 ribosomal protein L9, putative [Ixodes scapularis]
MLKRATQVTPTLLRNLQPLRHEQVRTTVVVKRVHTPHLSKIWAKTPRTLRSRHYIYEYDEVTEVKKKEPLDVILMDVVEGLGNKWDIVSVTPVYGLTQLIVPGLAIYATPDNLALREKMKQINKADRVPVLFRIQHVSRKLSDEVVSEVPYDKLPVEALLPEQRDLLRELAPDKVVDTAGS